LQDGFENISWFRDVREVNFRFWRGFRARGGGRARLAALQVRAHSIGFVKLKGAGVGLFLGDTYSIENVKNCLALDLQFTR
jgi:hypothetical protein